MPPYALQKIICLNQKHAVISFLIIAIMLPLSYVNEQNAAACGDSVKSAFLCTVLLQFVSIVIFFETHGTEHGSHDFAICKRWTK